MKAQDLVIGDSYSDLEQLGVELIYVGTIKTSFYKGQHDFDDVEPSVMGSICNDEELEKFIRPFED